MNRLLHYELVEQLGEGGMGVVYKARDTRLGRFVAVKVLAPGKASDPDRRQRFAREARAASALAHPNVLTVHEIGSEDGVDFIVTEYVPGKTLAQLIPPRGLPVREVFRWAVPIADALAATHAAGVIHRDLKPANVMMTDAGLVKILDFGLARFIDPGPMAEGDETEAVLTREGTVFGTCAYMSPEQAEGREVDARSDIFSLGTVLYEMVTGRRAFARDSASATIAAVLRDEPEPAGMVSPGLPPELERVIHRCLRKEPAKRYQSMADLKVALEELRDESESGAPARARAARPRRRAVLAAAAVVLVAAGAGGWLARRPAPEAVESTRPIPLTSFGGRILWPALSPDGNQVAFVWNGETQASFDLYVKLVGPGSPVRLTTDPGTEYSPAWSPDGRQIAFLRHLPSGEWILAVIPALGGPERIVAEAPVFHQGIAWSADGRSLVVAHRGTGDRVSALCRVLIATGEVKALVRPPPELLGLGDFSPALSPDGRTLAFARARTVVSSSLHVLRVTAELGPEGEPVPLTSDLTASSQPAWAPDGKRIVYTEDGFGWSSSPNLMVIPASPSGGQKARRVLGGEGGEFPSLSRNGSLVFARPINDLNLWRLPLKEGRPGRPEPLLSSTRMDGAPALSADGLRLVFTSDRGGSMQLWLASADGSHPVQLTSIVATNTSGGRWSPDGSRLVFTSNPEGNRDVFLTTPNGREPLRLTRGPSHDTSPSWSRDGAWVYFGSNREDGFYVWKMKPEPGALPVRVTRGGGYTLRESADGRTLYVARQMGSGHGNGRWSVWKMPAGGGEETLLIPRLAQPWFFEVTARGIYYLTSELPGGELRFRRFSDGSDTLLLALDKRSGFGLAAASDDSAVLYTVYDVDATELMYVEKFR
ncbi:MAG: PD40 domain-containing protein [Holophagales bacterium]|nr:PD40 domain-containing protein [Holophagales bacterium]